MRDLDCVVYGSCVADVLCQPLPLDKPLNLRVVHQVGPIALTAGGITANSGISMARLGLRVGVLTAVGRDAWGPLIREIFERERVDTSHLIEHPAAPTAVAVVAVADGGERAFITCNGATKLLGAADILARLHFLSRSKWLLLGYFSRMPRLEPELPEVLRQVRRVGCRTAMDAGGDGGTLAQLEPVLPHLDAYIPSLQELSRQTGEDDPQRGLARLRTSGAAGVIGVKLGADGVLISERPGEMVHLPACDPPGPVVDTTGAGDSFYAGLIAGLVRGLPLEQAGRLGCACGAFACTALGGWHAAVSYERAAQLANL